MKMHYLALVFGLMCLHTSISAQENTEYKWEFGLDLTPLIALPYTNSGSGLSFELIGRRQLTKKTKLRFRYEVNRESTWGATETGFNFFNKDIEPSTDGTLRFISNVHYQNTNKGVYLGWQKEFSVNAFKMYWGVDLNGQLNAGEVWSEVLLEGQTPFDPQSILLPPRVFSGVVNSYQNFQLAAVPLLGVDISLNKRINFMIEFGAKLGYRWNKIPFIRNFEEVNYVGGSEIFIDAFPVKDIAVAFRF